MNAGVTMERDRAREYEKVTRGQRGAAKRGRERERDRDLARRPYWRNSRGRDPINNGTTSRHVPAARGADASATGETHVLHDSVYTVRCTSAASHALHIHTRLRSSRSLFLSLSCVCETHVYADINPTTTTTTKTERTWLLVP